jgi:hypothetical protein
MNRYRKPHRFKKKESFVKNRIFLYSLLGLFVFSGMIYFVYLSPVLWAKEIIVERVEAEDAPGVSLVSDKIMEDCRLLLENAVKGKFFFWDTKSIFLLNSRVLEKQIIENYPELETVKIRKKWPDKVKVLLERKEGMALLRTTDGVFLLDAEGNIFDNASSSDQGLIVLAKPDYLTDSGESVVSKEDLEKILYAEGELEALGIFVDDFLLYSEDKLIIETKEGWDIYFSLQKDLDWQITKLNAVLEEVVTAEKREDLEYIEVRFSNRIFPKYKD